MKKPFPVAALLLTGGCQAAAVSLETFGPPTMAEQYYGERVAFGYRVTDAKPDAGSDDFFVNIAQTGSKTLGVKTWLAGWVPHNKEPLQRRFKECSGTP